MSEAKADQEPESPGILRVFLGLRLTKPRTVVPIDALLRRFGEGVEGLQAAVVAGGQSGGVGSDDGRLVEEIDHLRLQEKLELSAADVDEERIVEGDVGAGDILRPDGTAVGEVVGLGARFTEVPEFGGITDLWLGINGAKCAVGSAGEEVLQQAQRQVVVGRGNRVPHHPGAELVGLVDQQQTFRYIRGRFLVFLIFEEAARHRPIVVFQYPDGQ